MGKSKASKQRDKEARRLQKENRRDDKDSASNSRYNTRSRGSSQQDANMPPPRGYPNGDRNGSYSLSASRWNPEPELARRARTDEPFSPDAGNRQYQSYAPPRNNYSSVPPPGDRNGLRDYPPQRSSYDYLLPAEDRPPTWQGPPGVPSHPTAYSLPPPTSSTYVPPPSQSYPSQPPLPPGPPPSGPPGYDSFKPQSSDFSFRVAKPAGVQESYAGDSYRPSEPRRGRDQGRRDQSHRERLDKWKQGGAARGGRGGRNFNGPNGRPRRPFNPSERALLSGNAPRMPEQALFDANAGQTFRSLDDVTDDEEVEMDMSDEGDAGQGDEPSQKRARTSVGTDTKADDLPKWSNPDVYSAMQGIDPTTLQKKKDVVKLIRKARVSTTDARAPAGEDTADFISFDFDSEKDDSDDDVQVLGSRRVPPPQAPTGPAAQLPLAPSTNLPPRPQALGNLSDYIVTSRENVPLTHAGPSDPALGSRKRMHNDNIKLPSHAQLKKTKKKPVNGLLSVEWRIRQGQNQSSRPWVCNDHSNSVTPGVWLHKEVVDFYEHIKPCAFEDKLRDDLVQSLKEFTREVFGNAEVYAFGSFSSGLYLPTGDMDLVLCNDNYYNNRGPPKYNAKKQLYIVANTIKRHGLCRGGDVEVIAKAKVPLVKYIDKNTGLKVDMSFENLTGIQAIRTFKAWKEQYPAMPILVTLIKQFLLMRGLNEPVNGGLGGFSVICLVVSMLQQMPEVQSGNMNTLHHLGDLLMNFFDLYGNKFDYETTAISLNPPQYIPKSQVQSFAYKSHDRLSIIDPNNSANDISGGSSNVANIFGNFAHAHQLLAERMVEVMHLPDDRKKFASILEVVFAGNYATFREQREHMRKLSERPLPARPRVSAPVGKGRAPSGPSQNNRNGKANKGGKGAYSSLAGNNSGYRGNGSRR